MTRHSFAAFGGSSCEIIAPGAPDRDVSAAVAEVYAFQSRLTRFDPGSELMQFNARAGKRVPVSPLLNELLCVALEACDLSDGVVNAAVHHSLVSAGYDRTIEDVRRGGGASLRSASAHPTSPLAQILDTGPGLGWARLAPGHAVDLGCIGKGWLADRLCERFDNAVVNLGGDLRARGGGPDGAGWTVGLCDGSRLLIREAGVATSGTSGRHWRDGHHLIDPSTGRCAGTDIAAVSVAAADALTAEVLATGAAVVGSGRTGAWLAGRGAIHHAVVRSDLAIPASCGVEGTP